jgi:plasmid stabilization system protein ParE
MALPVELDPKAEQEARAAFLWYLERSPRAAEAFEREVERAIVRIGETPDTYPVIDGDLRRYLLERFPYALLYVIGQRNVRVVAVAHQHRRPGYWTER